MSVDSTLGLADLLVDPAQRAPGPIMAKLVVDDPIRHAGRVMRLEKPDLTQKHAGPVSPDAPASPFDES
jgi:hypothetical protein